MLFMDVIGTEVRKLPGRFPVPWIRIVLVVMALAIAVGLGFGARIAYSALTSRGNAAPVVPAPAIQQPVAQPAQQVPEVAAPVVLNYQVVWTEVKGFDPSTIPVEEGIYDAQYSWSSTKGAYAWRILPQLVEGLPVAVSATRDEHNKNIVFASLDADNYGPLLLLSVDGERSWYRLNLLPIVWKGQTTNGVTPEEVRVVAQGEEIHLYGRYARGAGPSNLYWWTAVVRKGELP